MFWMLGLTALSMLGGAQTARAQARGQIAQIEGDRKVRRANQEEANAKQGLAQHMQNLQNDRILRAAAKQQAAATTNLLRTQDTATQNDLESQIAASEAGGAYAANVASKGVGGSSVDMIDQTLRARDQRAAELRSRNQRYVTYDMAQQLAGVVPGGIQATDLGVKSMGVDYSTRAPEVGRGYDFAGAVAKSGLAELLDKGTAAAIGNWGSTSGGGMGLKLDGGGLGLTTKGVSGFWNTGLGSIKLS